MHYVCKTCGGVSAVPKKCETEGCAMIGQELTACDCEDPEHLDKLKAVEPGEGHEHDGNEEPTQEQS